MAELTFRVLAPNTPIKVGLVVMRVVDKMALYSRITHVFERTVYLMPIGSPSCVRFALRPTRGRIADLILDLKARRVSIGQVNLPTEFTATLAEDSEEYKKVEASMEVIQPLVAAFDEEPNLGRTKFTLLIERRADQLGWSPVSLRKLLLRFYYFGRHKNALLNLDPGPVPVENSLSASAVAEKATGQRRGARNLLCKTKGPNLFIVMGEDVEDMVVATERIAKDAASRSKNGAFVRGTVKGAHEAWLLKDFARRPKNKAIYAAWRAGSHVVPLSRSQFRRYVLANNRLNDDLREYMPAFDVDSSSRALKSTGPGDVYELDATGGQIVLVDSKNPTKILATPTIYIVIDRWSRYIVSIYVTLRAASWEALRVALRIAFTSRDRRFKHLGFPVDDVIWPVGSPPAQLAVDRGTEMISEAMLEAAVDGLDIEVLPLPPQTPDGKGIVERAIRKLKRLLVESRTPGQYDKVAIAPKRKAGKRHARIAAVTSLAELYRVLVSIVVEYNNRTVHASLKGRSILKVNGVRPIPRDAYLWGLKNLTGIRRSSHTDEDLRRILLGNATAHLSGQVFTYRSRHYWPANPAAKRFLRLAGASNRKPYQVKVDDSDPFEIFMPQRGREWAQWKIGEAGEADLANITIEEQVALDEAHKILIAEAENDDLRSKGDKPAAAKSRRVASASAPSQSPIASSTQELAESRKRESDALDQALDGRRKPPPSRSDGESSAATLILRAAALLKKQRADAVEANKRRRQK